LPSILTRERVLAIIQEAFDSLTASDLIPDTVTANDATALLGTDTLLDSIAFVTFMVEVEDRLQAALPPAAAPATLAINDIHDYNPDKSRLTVGVLADFILRTFVTGPADGG
jgi:acyl carrier protein